jgi:hypothetical protein
MTHLIDRGSAYEVVCNYLDINEQINEVLLNIIEELGKLPYKPSELFHEGYEKGYKEAMEDIAGEAGYKQGYEDGFTDAKAGRDNEYKADEKYKDAYNEGFEDAKELYG